jgi:tetratricopeptide (TPR) repeat protein
MQTNSFSFLHLTDLHFGLSGQTSLWPNLRQAFLDDLENLHKHTGPWQAVLFTGDLVQQGKSAEFAAMQQEVLDRLWQKLAELGSSDAVLLAVPGNHDLYRPDPRQDNAAVDTLLEEDGFTRIAAKFWDKATSPYRIIVSEAFASYTEWWQATPRRAPGIQHGILPGDFACTLPCGDQQIGIVGLNTAFLQLGGGDYQSKLVWDARQLQAVCGGAVDDWVKRHDVCLLLTHQGPDWLTPEAREHGASEIAPAGRFGAHLYGHMHATRLHTVHVGGNPDAMRLLQGCSVFGMEKYGEPPTLTRTHGYMAGKITFADGQASLRLWPRLATNNTGPWRFIPDHANMYLEGDNGSHAELVSHGRPKRKPASPGALVGTYAGTHADSHADAHTGAHPSAHTGTAQQTVTHSQIANSTLPGRRPFFGRTDELAKIAKYLQPGFTGWGVVLDGPGGMGKTALALEAAHLAPTEVYPLKVFVSAKQTRLDPDGERALHDSRVSDYFELLTEIGLALGRNEIQRTPPQERAKLILHALAAQKVLLVLDNLESFQPEERRRIYDLLEVLPAGCRAIVTSRRSENTTARTLRLDKLEFDAARQLLAELGERLPPVAKLTPTEQQTLYEETGGNPLLLSWVAAQLGLPQGRCRSVADAVERLRHAHEQQQINQKNDPLEFVFGDLLDTFTENETALLAALVHFTMPARLDWLLPLAKLSQTAAETALDDLRNRALLIEDETNASWFLPPLCAHFLRLRRPQAVTTSGQRLASRAAALALQFGGYANAPFQELEAVWPQIEAALTLLLAGENAVLQRVCDALAKFLHFSGRWNVWLELSEAAEAKAVAAGDAPNAGLRAYQAACVYVLQGDGAAVLLASERCSRHWQAAGAGADGRAGALRLRGLGYRTLQNYPAAITAQQESLALLRASAPDSVAVADGLSALAGAKYAAADLDGAQADYNEALRLASQHDDREGIATTTSNLADLLLKRKDWPAAEQLATQALALSLALGRLELIGGNHNNLAQALHQQQRSSEALAHACEAVAIFTRLQSPRLAKATATLAACEAAVRNGLA